MMKYSFIILTAFLFSNTFSQQQKPSTYQKGDSLFQESNFEDALKLYEMQSEKHKENEAWELYVVGKNKVAYCLLRLGEFTKAQEILEEDLSIITSKKINNSNLLQTIYGELGEIDLSEGDFNDAIKNFEKEASFFTDKTDYIIKATNKSNIGIAQSQLGNFFTALEFLKQALAIRKANEDSKGIADTYNNIGLLYASRDSKAALDNYEKALLFYNKSVGAKHPSYLNTLNNQAIIYRSTGEAEKALSIFETVLKNWKLMYGTQHPNVAFTYSNIGLVYLDFNMLDTALIYQQKALSIYKEVYGLQHPEIANTHNQIANIYRSQQKYDEAIKETQKSIAANCKEFNPTLETSLPDPKKACLNRQLLAVTLHLKSKLLLDRHYNNTLKLSDLKLALECLKVCDVAIEEQRHFLKSKSDKINLGKLAAEVYEDAISTAFTLSQNSVTHKKEFLSIAFQFSEKSKAAVLLESLADANAKNFANIPKSILEEEEKFTHKINALNQELIHKDDPSKRDELISLTKSHETFILNLETKYPDYFNLKYNVNLANVSDIQKKLDNSSLLISYFIAESNKRLYIFKISKTKFSVINAPLLADFNNQITGYRNSMFYNAYDSYIESAHLLYKQLFPKHLPHDITSLIIIPDGRLSVVPFESLLIKKTKPHSSYTNLSYLINEYEITYNFSSTLYLQSLQPKEKKEKTEVLLSAPITFDGLAKLPGTLEEVEQIAKLFQANNISTTSYLNNNATESRLKSNEITNYDYIHLATHGVVNERYPDLSQIYLKADIQNDGNLYTSEIYGLKLKAKLVTLSACETGLGQISRGEGIVGLSRSLIFSGAENLVVSYWQVADESTSRLMIGFYKNLLENPKRDISFALRASKLELLNSKEFAAPYYWAPLIGN